MSTVCGLDPSLTSCGIAVLHNGAPAEIRCIGHSGRDGANYAQRSDRIVSQSRAVIGEVTCWDLDLAVIEGPAYGENLPSNHDRAGLWWGLYSALRAKQIPTAVIPPATAKKWATGHGRATKADMLHTVRGWWPGVTIANNDIADALVLAALGAFKLGDPLPFPVKDRHRNGLDAVAWPEGVCR